MHPAEPFIVTLDGPAGVGKSTLARRVAAHLNIAYLDTGAMFRTIANELGEKGLLLPAPELEKRLASLSFSLSGIGETTSLACNGLVAGQEIRSERMGFLAAKFAESPIVRDNLKNIQQTLGNSFSLVAEGRDMGSAVFPKAPCKFFLDAKPEVRAMRRMRQIEATGEKCDFAGLVEQIRRRDAVDRARKISPLRAAEDAHYIDTGALDVDGVFDAIIKRIPALYLSS